MDVCSSVGWPDREIGEIAGRQRGLITRVQLFALGQRRSAIDHALVRGRLRLIHRGVYAVGHRALPPGADQLAAVLAVGAGALLSHRSAAAIWGLTPPHDGDVEVTIVARDAGRRRAGISVHLAASLHPSDADVRDGIPITSAARALLDIAPGLSARELERAFDRGLKGGVLTRDAVSATARRARRHPGARRVGELAAPDPRASTETRSESEERFLALIRAAELPVPELNVRVGRFTVDALWRTQRLIVEVDGYAFHSTRWSFESDRERDLELAAIGFRVMRFTWDQIANRPGWVLVKLAQQLAASRPRGPAA
jgi:very-short-patch-repair endonuclease